MRKKKKPESAQGKTDRNLRKIRKIETKSNPKGVIKKKSRMGIEKIKRERENILDQLKIEYSKLEQLLSKFDPIQVLTAFSSILLLSNSIKILTSENSLSSFPDREISMDYLLSFALSIEYPENPKEVPKDDIGAIKEIYQTIEAIFRKTKDYYFNEFVVEFRNTLEEPEIRPRLIFKSLNQRGHYYLTHFVSFMSEFVDLISSYNLKELGTAISFSIKELWDFLQSCTKNIIRKYHLEIETLKLVSDINVKFSEFSDQFLVENTKLIDKALKQNPHLSGGDQELMDGLVQEFNLKYNEQINEIKQKQVELGGGIDPNIKFIIKPRSSKEKEIIKEISLRLGENKNIFADPKNPYNILNPTLIKYKPLINHNNTYYCFNHFLPVRNFLNISEKLIKENNESYHRNFLSQRDKFTEKQAKDLFQKLLQSSQSNTLSSLYYGDFELDIMIIQDRALLLIEVKAGMLPASATRGSVQSYMKGMKQLIGKSFEQSDRALKYIKSNSPAKFYKKDRRTLLTEINLSDYDYIIPISVFLENIGDSITNLGLMNKLKFVKGYNFWAVNIFDLYVFVELIKYPSQFVHYLTLRSSMSGKEKFGQLDELDFLGFYFANNGQFSREQQTKIKDSSEILLIDYTEKFDNYFYEKDLHYYLGRKNHTSPLPQQEMPHYFELLISKLNYLKPEYFISVSVPLLDLKEERKQKISNTLKNWQKDTKDHLIAFSSKNIRISIVRSQKLTLESLKPRLKKRTDISKYEKWFILVWDKPLQEEDCNLQVGLVKD